MRPALSLAVLMNAGSVMAAEPDRTAIAAKFRAIAAEFYSAANCNFSAPDEDCIPKIMTPLREAKGVPFDTDAVLRAFTAFGPYVGKEWQLTTLHRFPFKTLGSKEECAFSDFQYSGMPFPVPGCGTFLFIGGHPKIKDCKPVNDPFRCLGEIPLEERPDIGLVRVEAREGRLQVAGVESVSPGDVVYVVHQPFFQWMDYTRGGTFREKSPYLTKALFFGAKGMTGTLIAPAFNGSSGGTVLNKEGKVIGVLTAIRVGIPVSHFQILNPRMIEVIETAAQQ